MSDRISGLPDSLLLHILYFLQTKDVVTTSLFSKRWRTLWRSLPKLEFDEGSFHRVESLVQFVDAALHLVHPNSVQMFVLKCRRFSLPPVKVNIWVNALVSYKLTHLELHFPRKLIILPSSIFICSTLSVLKLTGVRVSNLSMVDFPSLKVLHLKVVQFSSPKCVAKLLSKCLHLEELVLKLLDIPDMGSTLNIRRFKHLLFADVPAYLIPMKAFPNVQFLSLSEDIWYPGYNIPTFHNLIHLEIHHFGRSDWTIVSCLQDFPHLQSLTILNYGYESEDKWMMKPTHDVPPCVSSHLREFTLIGFQGFNFEFEIVKRIMGNARVLETIIVGSAGSSERKGFEMLKKLSSYPRCSEKCRLFFEVSSTSIDEAMRKFLTIRPVAR